MRRGFLASLCGSAVVIAVASVPAAGQAQSAVPRTAWGHPDMQGIWNNSTLTRMQRRAEFAGKPVLTEAEAAASEARVAAGRVDAPPRAGDPGTYTQHWFDRGNKVVPDRRTSLIVDPADGKVPALTPAAKKRLDAAAAARRGLPASYEDIDVGERCFTDGLPL